MMKLLKEVDSMWSKHWQKPRYTLRSYTHSHIRESPPSGNPNDRGDGTDDYSVAIWLQFSETTWSAKLYTYLPTADAYINYTTKGYDEKAYNEAKKPKEEPAEE